MLGIPKPLGGLHDHILRHDKELQVFLSFLQWAQLMRWENLVSNFPSSSCSLSLNDKDPIKFISI